MKTMVLAAMGAALLVHPSRAQAQGPDIQHAPLGCIVAGKFPRVDACFAAETARARVYFKGLEGAHWYWVDFQPAATCHNAILPRPSKALKQMLYYVEVLGRDHLSARTDDRTVDIVPDAGGCKKELPVAGWVQNAAVSVGAPAGAPVFPAGFAMSGAAVGGGIGAGTVLGGVAATSAAAYGGATLLSGEGGETEATPTPGPTSAPVAVPTSAPTAAPTPTPTPPPAPTPPPQPFRAAIVIGPTSGVEPLSVTFDGCGSTGQNLQFGYDYDGDGIDDQRGPCRVTRTYTTTGVSLATARRSAADYRVTMTVWERVSDGQSQSQTAIVHVDPAGPACGPPGPTVAMTSPPNGGTLTADPSTLSASASDPDGMTGVQFKARRVFPTPGPVVDAGTASGPGPAYSVSWDLPCEFGTQYEIGAEATDACGNVTTSAKVTVTVNNFSCAALAPDAETSSSGWTSELDVEDGAGRLVLNDAEAHAVPRGRTSGRHAPGAAVTRVDFTLQHARRAGRWEFAMRGAEGWDPAKVRVLSGEVMSLTREAIVFRLKGQAGERIRFTFE